LIRGTTSPDREPRRLICALAPVTIRHKADQRSDF
jgi:hypothetical protein